MICPNCNKVIDPKYKYKTHIFKVHDLQVEINDHTPYCPECCTELNQPKRDYETYEAFRNRYCQTCEQQCSVKYVGNLQDCLGYQQTCLCKICIDDKCAARGLDLINAGCIHYQPDPSIIEFWYKGRKIIDKNKVFTEKYFETDDHD